jgi:flagellar biosynthesis protein FliR
MPQMNLMSLGVTINIFVGIVMIISGLAGWAVVSQDTFRELFDTLSRFFS